MRTLGLLITLLAAAPQAATDQKRRRARRHRHLLGAGDRVRFDRLSPGLQQDIRNLAGTPLKQERLDELAARIEEERPRYVAAVRTVMDPDGQARVFFVVGRQASPARRQRQRALCRRARRHHRRARRRADAGAARRLAGAGRQAPRFRRRRSAAGAPGARSSGLRGVPAHPARERSGPHPARVRGAQEGAAELAALRAAAIERSSITPTTGGAATGTSASATATSGSHQSSPSTTSDDLVEEYSGYGLRFETRKLGTRRLGASFEWSWFDAGLA